MPSASVQLIYEDEHGKQFIASHIADRGEFWWNERKPDERVLWESKIHLSEPFFNEIIQHPVPLDMNTLTALKRSTLGLDLYLWLVYRTFTLRAPLRLSPGVRSTVSLECTRPRPATSAPLTPFAQRFSAS